MEAGPVWMEMVRIVVQDVATSSGRGLAGEATSEPANNVLCEYVESRAGCYWEGQIRSSVLFLRFRVATQCLTDSFFYLLA